MWSHKPWQGSFFSQDADSSDFLQQYASVFNCVEGNTTFYAIPSAAAVQSWNEATPRDFRFSFKLPKMISHDLKLQRCELANKTFFDRMQPLRDKMGPVMIQLPAGFSPSDLGLLQAFIRGLPTEYAYALEVRHPQFFDSGDHEAALVELLEKYRIDRVCFDSRALFASTSTDEMTVDAKRKKPKLPVHAMAIGRQPVIRFIGHDDLAENERYFADWVKKIVQWIAMGKCPYLFVHLANNHEAPKLALRLHQQLQNGLADLSDLPRWPVERETNTGQIGLF